MALARARCGWARLGLVGLGVARISLPVARLGLGGTAGLGCGPARHGPVWRGGDRHGIGKVRQWLGKARRGSVSHGEDTATARQGIRLGSGCGYGMAALMVQACVGEGKAGRWISFQYGAGPGMASPGGAGHDVARLGMAGNSLRGKAWPGMVGHCGARVGMAWKGWAAQGMERFPRQGKVWYGWVGQCLFRFGKAGDSFSGLGKARLGASRLGVARRCKGRAG